MLELFPQFLLYLLSRVVREKTWIRQNSKTKR